ncbi:hypothetical protein DMH01_22065 [Amycolatopsis sp. WAC 04182]|uniref:hypothetical protein n=1 Tax=Amycolatopsis sp. WAC 04182 TaxID=2203198 RepID=UPI000F78B67A|nr:hypothetical protein [Amycolatopsis sp. WAC 04182]RSN58718.1 hypothetical protein DMH01_22065 [Amycolatopsis sp. WAC 04182]
MPKTGALFGYDVIGSSSVDDDLLEEVRGNATDFVLEALEHVGVEERSRANYSSTGDGALAVYPESELPALIDAAYFLQGKLYLHNRAHRPAIRLRLAVHTAPVRITEEDNFQRPTIELARLLDAAEFKRVVRRMPDQNPVTVALVVSDQAYRVAVRSRHTQRLLPHDFGKVEVINKEFTEDCWIWIPGLDAERVRELSLPEPSAQPLEQPASAPHGQPAPGGIVIQGGLEGNNFLGANHGKITATYQQPGGNP